MPRAPEAPRQSSESPLPQRPRTRAQFGEPTAQSPAAAASPARPSSREEANWREMVEMQSHTQKLLTAVFEMVITEEAAASILDTYPELTWLANCLRRCPLPPGWTAADIGNGQLQYINMGTGNTQDHSPLLERFAELGKLMLSWRQCPNFAADVATALKHKHEHDLEEAIRARKVWKGPHIDPDTGLEFWHCPATGRSAWGDPGMASEFLSRVAERLQRAIPASPVTSPSNGSGSSSCSFEAPAEPDPAESLAVCIAENAINSAVGAARRLPSRSGERPPSRHGERPPSRSGERPPSRAGEVNKISTMDQNAVRQMLAEIAANATAAAANAETQQPRASAAPRAPPARMCQAAAQDAPPQDADAERTPERGRRPDTDSRDSPMAGGSRHRRIVPGDVLSETTENYLRPECRRRRFDSSERLTPLEGPCARSGMHTPRSVSEAEPEPVPSTEPRVNAETDRLDSAPQSAGIAPASPSIGRPKSRHGSGTSEALAASVTAPEMQQSMKKNAFKHSMRKPPSGALAGTHGERQPSGMNQSFKMACSRGMDQSFKKKTGSASTQDAAVSLGGTCASMMGATAGSQLGSTAVLGQMCAGAIAQAIDDALVTHDDGCDSVDFCDEEYQESPPITPTMLGRMFAEEKDADNCECDEEESPPTTPNMPWQKRAEVKDIHGCECDAKGSPLTTESVPGQGDAKVKGAAPPSPPASPSLMSICRSLSPTRKEDRDNSRAESPSILVLDEGPCWSSNKALPKPRTPPRSPRPRTPPRSCRGERPVLLGVPEPLSARARCRANEPPLSVQLKSIRGPRPGARRQSTNGGA